MIIKEAMTYALAALIMHTCMTVIGAPTRDACATRVAHSNAQLAVHGIAHRYAVEKECY